MYRAILGQEALELAYDQGFAHPHPNTATPIAERMGKAQGYARRTFGDMVKLKLLKRTNDTPGVYSRAHDILPADLEALANMVSVYGGEAVSAAVEGAL